MRPETIDEIFALQPGDDEAFERVWLDVYLYQREHCDIYNRYCKSLDSVSRPYLPIDAFKQAPVVSFELEDADLTFKSSGTGTGEQAVHYVKDRFLYGRSSSTHFSQVFGGGPFTFLAHLPHYTEMGAASSLLYMVEHLIEKYGDPQSRFFLDDATVLEESLRRRSSNQMVLFGAAFGLLDLAENNAFRLPADALIVETGGMKTYRQEITRQELHDRLAGGFGIEKEQIWSEYGMCELLSQCYTRGGGIFLPPPWVRFEIMNPEYPLERQAAGQPGALAIIDLANVYSVSAILTQDRAIKRGSGFEVLGRLNGAELRGCNFLLERN